MDRLIQTSRRQARQVRLERNIHHEAKAPCDAHRKKAWGQAEAEAEAAHVHAVIAVAQAEAAAEVE